MNCKTYTHLAWCFEGSKGDRKRKRERERERDREREREREKKKGKERKRKKKKERKKERERKRERERERERKRLKFWLKRESSLLEEQTGQPRTSWLCGESSVGEHPTRDRELDNPHQS